MGLYFVGIDILGDYLIEVNVTSPTCLQEINRLCNVRLEEKVSAIRGAELGAQLLSGDRLAGGPQALGSGRL